MAESQFDKLYNGYHKAFPSHYKNLAQKPKEPIFVEGDTVIFNPTRLYKDELLAIRELTLVLRQEEWFRQISKKLDCLEAFGGESIVIE